MIKSLIYLVSFWGMQIVAQLLFKYGSLSEKQWLIGFIGGNLFGFSSIWLLMLLYREINVNIALGLAGGGSFLLSQIALSIIFKSNLTLLQWISIVIITLGMIGLCIGKLEKI